MFNFGVYVVVNPQCPTRDGRFMIMCPLYPSQERKILRLLNCGPDESQLRAAIIKRDALEMEAAAEALQVPFQMIRTREEWEASEQGQVNATDPFDLDREDRRKRPDSAAATVSDRSRAFVCCRWCTPWPARACPRTLAGQGADCLNLNMPDWIEYGNFFYQADVGLRQAYLDARKAENRPARVQALIKDADVFVDNLRPGVADTRRDTQQQALAERKPGHHRRQRQAERAPGDPGRIGPGSTSTLTESPASPRPKELRINRCRRSRSMVICDIMTGYLGAIGVKAALLRRAKEGGSYRVDVSLAQCCSFIMSLGLNDKDDDRQPRRPSARNTRS